MNVHFHTLAALPPGEENPVHIGLGRWASHRARLDAVEKRNSLVRARIRTPNPWPWKPCSHFYSNPRSSQIFRLCFSILVYDCFRVSSAHSILNPTYSTNQGTAHLVYATLRKEKFCASLNFPPAYEYRNYVENRIQ
jgi:hypothetical protein